ncbi:HAD family hydrolase [Erysipelothrix rhusiopathiae]|nr:HAD family hydrolase [Erysipelothrix rhusiopathiae]
MKNVNLSNALGIDTVLFDLDGTILPLDGDDFERAYLTSITQKVAHIIEPELMAKALWKSSAAMIQNQDELKTNEQVFYACFESLVGSEIKHEIDTILDDYYENEYNIVETVTSISPPMVETVRYLKEKGYKVILATNPLFQNLLLINAFGGRVSNWMILTILPDLRKTIIVNQTQCIMKKSYVIICWIQKNV